MVFYANMPIGRGTQNLITYSNTPLQIHFRNALASKNPLARTAIVTQHKCFHLICQVHG